MQIKIIIVVVCVFLTSNFSYSMESGDVNNSKVLATSMWIGKKAKNFYISCANYYLSKAASRGNVKNFEFWLKWGANDKPALKNILKSIIWDGDLEAARLFIEKNSAVLPHIKQLLNEGLHDSIEFSEPIMVDHYLSLGAGIENTERSYADSLTSELATPLQRALKNNNVQIAEYLLKRGALLKNMPDTMWSVLSASNPALLELLLKHNIPVDQELPEKLGTPLGYTALLDNTEYAKMLLKYGASVQESEPLSYAVKNNNLELIKTFLYVGMDPFQKDEKGKVAADFTQDTSLKEILENPLYIKNFCTQAEQQQFKKIVNKRRDRALFGKDKSIFSQVKQRELTGSFGKSIPRLVGTKKIQ